MSKTPGKKVEKSELPGPGKPKKSQVTGNKPQAKVGTVIVSNDDGGRPGAFRPPPRPGSTLQRDRALKGAATGLLHARKGDVGEVVLGAVGGAAGAAAGGWLGGPVGASIGANIGGAAGAGLGRRIGERMDARQRERERAAQHGGLTHGNDGQLGRLKQGALTHGKKSEVLDRDDPRGRRETMSTRRR